VGKEQLNVFVFVPLLFSAIYIVFLYWGRRCLC